MSYLRVRTYVRTSAANLYVLASSNRAPSFTVLTWRTLLRVILYGVEVSCCSGGPWNRFLRGPWTTCARGYENEDVNFTVIKFPRSARRSQSIHWQTTRFTRYERKAADDTHPRP